MGGFWLSAIILMCVFGLFKVCVGKGCVFVVCECVLVVCSAVVLCVVFCDASVDG